MTSDAQRRANQKQDATRKRVAIWLDQKTARQVDAAIKRLGLSSRLAFVQAALKEMLK